MNEMYKVNAKVEIFPREGGWHFVRVPMSTTKKLIHKADRGVIAIKASIGKTSWETSLLPMGDSTHFIALNKKVRKTEGVSLGDKIEIAFQLRS